MGNYCIKVRRKGFNYYSDYMERYFDKAAVNYGYHLIKNPEQADYSCITIINTPDMGSGGSPWMIFWSKTFDEIAYDKLQELSQVIAESFKSESIIEKADISEIIGAIKNGSMEYGMPYPWFFSKEHNAFEEPPFLVEGETKLKARS